MTLVNIYEKCSIFRIPKYLTKYDPRMLKTVDQNDRNIACRIFGEQKAIDLKLASPRKSEVISDEVIIHLIKGKIENFLRYRIIQVQAP